MRRVFNLFDNSTSSNSLEANNRSKINPAFSFSKLISPPAQKINNKWIYKISDSIFIIMTTYLRITSNIWAEMHNLIILIFCSFGWIFSNTLRKWDDRCFNTQNAVKKFSSILNFNDYFIIIVAIKKFNKIWDNLSRILMPLLKQELTNKSQLHAICK